VLTLEEAAGRMLAAAPAIAGVEELPTEAAVGRILARPVLALVDVPPADNAQMDGYAVRCADLAAGVPAVLPVALRIAAGQAPGVLPAGAAARIFTGAPIPDGCDAVVMQEAAGAVTAGVEIREQPVPGQWIRRRGADITRGSVALAAGQALRAQHLGIAASVGAAHLTVVRRPRVAFFCTGDELTLPGETAAPGRIYNSNRYVLAGLLQALGCEVHDLGIVRDQLAATQRALERAATGADLVLSSGGVSVGEEDHVKAALAALGELQAWRIAIKPGKPLAFGRVGSVPFIGLPGNPVASFVSFVILVRPFLLRCMGASDIRPRAAGVCADFERPADPLRREFLRARLNDSGRLELFPSQNSALLSSVSWADGLVDLPAGEAVVRGQTVRFLPFGELTGPP
jgi:molybdopterin molybdotransferase